MESLADTVRGGKYKSPKEESMVQIEGAKQETTSVGEIRMPAATAAQYGNAPVATRTIRVDIERIDALMNLFSELLIDRVRLEQLAHEVKRSD